MSNGEKGMDWMYKGPSALVNRDEYLTGRTVDKALKLLDATEKGDTNFSYQDEVEKDLTPMSIFSARTQGPVDVIRKIKEDPLFQIQKQEEERLRELLDNPVRLKKLQEMAKKQQGAAAASSSKAKANRSRRSSSSSDSSDDDGTDIDKLLAQKLKQLKDPQGLLSLSKSSSSKEESRQTERSRYRSDRDRRRSRSRSPRDSRHRYNEHSRDYRRSRSRSGDRDRRRRDDVRDRISSHKEKSYSRSDRDSNKRYEPSSSRGSSSRSSRPEPPPKRKEIDEEERQRKLREMMENCKWRDEQRVKNVSKHRDEVQKEEDMMKSKHDTEFIRKQLNVAAATGSVEKRIKANSYNIQRSKTAMDQNFARR